MTAVMMIVIQLTISKICVIIMISFTISVMIIVIVINIKFIMTNIIIFEDHDILVFEDHDLGDLRFAPAVDGPAHWTSGDGDGVMVMV